MYAKLDEAVEVLGSERFVGNLIPQAWYRTVVKSDGKPNFTAIVVLADLLYWFRPVRVYDSVTDSFKGYRMKFKGDLLQRSYAQLCSRLNISRFQAKSAVDFLCDLGVISKFLKNVRTGKGMLSNVMFIDINFSVLSKLTFIEGFEDFNGVAGDGDDDEVVVYGNNGFTGLDRRRFVECRIKYQIGYLNFVKRSCYEQFLVDEVL